MFALMVVYFFVPSSFRCECNIFEVRQKERIYLTRPSLNGSNLFEMPFYSFFSASLYQRANEKQKHHTTVIFCLRFISQPVLLKPSIPPRQCRRWPDKSPHFCITAPALLIISWHTYNIYSASTLHLRIHSIEYVFFIPGIFLSWVDDCTLN